MKRTKLLLALPILLGTLYGCENEEKEARILEREDFAIVDTYDYDLVKVVVEEEKTAEELATEILLDEMGLNIEDSVSYERYGISNSNGIFVNAAILDGTELPTVSGFDLETINALNTDSGADEETLTYTKFNDLQANRERSVSSYNQNKELNATELSEAIEKAAAIQKEKIANQEKEKELQNASNGGELEEEVVENE